MRQSGPSSASNARHRSALPRSSARNSFMRASLASIWSMPRLVEPKKLLQDLALLHAALRGRLGLAFAVDATEVLDPILDHEKGLDLVEVESEHVTELEDPLHLLQVRLVVAPLTAGGVTGGAQHAQLLVVAQRPRRDSKAGRGVTDAQSRVGIFGPRAGNGRLPLLAPGSPGAGSALPLPLVGPRGRGHPRHVPLVVFVSSPIAGVGGTSPRVVVSTHHRLPTSARAASASD